MTILESRGVALTADDLLCASILKQWCADMEARVKGRISLANLLYDILHQRVPPETLREFLCSAATSWATADMPRPMAITILEKIKKEKTSRLHFGCGSLVSNNATLPQMSRVMDVRDLQLFNLKLDKLPYAVLGRMEDSQLQTIAKYGFGDGTRGNMETGLPFAWVTQTDQLDQVRATADPADEARKQLGLKHFDEDQQLVEIRYPTDAVAPTMLRVPTFVEGCPSLVFRSKTDGDGWGRSVHLETHSDGLPEAVHPSIPFTNRFSLTTLGILPPMLKGFDWATFETTMPTPWTSTSFDELVNYVYK